MAESRKSVKITKRVVDAIKPDGTDFYVFDSELTGFGVRVPSQARCPTSSAIGPDRGEVHGPKCHYSQGWKVTPDQAREEARDILASVVKGEDPAREKAERRTALTFAQLAEHYLDHVAAKKKPKTQDLYKHMLMAYAFPSSDHVARRTSGLRTWPRSICLCGASPSLPTGFGRNQFDVRLGPRSEDFAENGEPSRGY